MAARSSSSSSSSSSETEEITTGVLGGSVSTENIQRSAPLQREASSTASQISAVATGTPYDTLSIATTNTGFTNTTNFTANTSVSQQQAGIGGNIPIIRPPTFDQLSTTNTSATTQPIRIDVASAQQQTIHSEISPYSGSTTSSTGGSLSSPGTASLQQQQQQQQRRFDVSKAIFTQADTNRDGFISRDEFRQWAQNATPATTSAGGSTSNQYDHQFQQTQFANQYSTQQQQQQQVFNNVQNAPLSADTSLFIDYGAIEAYNVGLQSAGDITAEQLAGKFDVAKAIFKQVDTNHDGSISREEFRHWGQNATPNPAAQSYAYGNHSNQGNLFAGAAPDVANILQQSGLGQGYGGY